MHLIRVQTRRTNLSRVKSLRPFAAAAHTSTEKNAAAAMTTNADDLVDRLASALARTARVPADGPTVDRVQRARGGPPGRRRWLWRLPWSWCDAFSLVPPPASTACWYISQPNSSAWAHQCLFCALIRCNSCDDPVRTLCTTHAGGSRFKHAHLTPSPTPRGCQSLP